MSVLSAAVQVMVVVELVLVVADQQRNCSKRGSKKRDPCVFACAESEKKRVRRGKHALTRHARLYLSSLSVPFLLVHQYLRW